MAAEPDKKAEGAEGKPSAGKGGFIIALLILAVLGAGAGAGFSLTFLQPGTPTDQAGNATEPAAKKSEADKAKPADGGKSTAKAESEGPKERVSALEPIIVTLAGPQRSWARLELGVILADDPKEDQTPLLKTMTEDLMSFLRTVPLVHVESAAGVEYLREDLSEIVRLRSKGRARGVILRSLVVE